jgi:hypothetical protein
MSSNPQVPSSSEAPVAQSDLRTLSMVVDICQKLGGVTKAVSNLEDANKSNSEKIDQLTQWVFAIPSLEKAVGESTKDLSELRKCHDKDLNELGRRLGKDINELAQRHDKKIAEIDNFVHTAKTFSAVSLAVATPVAAAIIIAIVTGIYHVVEKLLSLVK